MNTLNENEVISIKDKLIDLIQNDPDLPTLGNSISKVVQLTSSDEQSLEQLSNFILSVFRRENKASGLYFGRPLNSGKLHKL